MKVEVATMAGGTTNQDFCLVGEDFAIVLDGASSFNGGHPTYSARWYVQQLAAAIASRMAVQTPLSSIVGSAIADMAMRLPDGLEESPSSTVALARWGRERLETYVLGDSSITVIAHDQDHSITDLRMARIAEGVRRTYRQRLQDGSGFDDSHRELLRTLQTEQRKSRNTANGYWIAERDQEAAKHAVEDSFAKGDVQEVVLASDGGTTVLEYGLLPRWRSLGQASASHLLEEARRIEQADADGRCWPRSKRHDDKTILALAF